MREERTSGVGGYGSMYVGKNQQSTMIYVHGNAYMCAYIICVYLVPHKRDNAFPRSQLQSPPRCDTSGVVGRGV